MTSKVKLVGMTSPSASSGCHTAGDLIAYAARVSNPMNQNNKKTASKLLRYLIKEGHWSPFEMVSITMEICVNVFQLSKSFTRIILKGRVKEKLLTSLGKINNLR